MDTKTYAEVHETLPKKDEKSYRDIFGHDPMPTVGSANPRKEGDYSVVSQLEKKLAEAEAKLENYKLLASYVQDVVDFWPNMTMRTIRVMIPKMEALKEALALVGK